MGEKNSLYCYNYYYYLFLNHMKQFGIIVKIMTRNRILQVNISYYLLISYIPLDTVRTIKEVIM